ncbi:hypothetical protein A2870_01570 [Candidatus Curtissbacteria bacterium RIFCSPHIGHO2_01_FULL_41_11]|uniref:Uncharacterized protein n=1 Tax=Candidatus Curtissbacteria bacterium RIFCSPHIGHO2_01_FULL_41_11 TaxID=1797711 RepID=A0A1F5G6G3_9BACT|nr:MAG: hypothetical protein A2870_01570 [Candidatus Curtissbacteria bacterium RIFCSPHIGHO2_01_FULL_41_11]
MTESICEGFDVSVFRAEALWFEVICRVQDNPTISVEELDYRLKRLSYFGEHSPSRLRSIICDDLERSFEGSGRFKAKIVQKSALLMSQLGYLGEVNVKS